LIDIQEVTKIPPGEIKLIRGMKTAQRMALVRWYSLVDEKEAQRPPLGERCHLPYAMKEVSQTTTAEWLNCFHVVNICFIFHLEAIQKRFVSCGGWIESISFGSTSPVGFLLH
jgi:hypothetical protein